MTDKKRLDIAVTERGYTESREKAKALIMSGLVYVDGQKADKPGMNISESQKIEVRGEDMPFVSRGGYKLDKAIKSFNIDLKNNICMDIGASTGGFTDCMLQNGAIKVYSVDVGYGQLAWKLRSDQRVINMERTNIRYVEQKDIDDKLDFASIDVSFISLKLVLPVLAKLLKQDGHAVCLIKPQFEAGKGKVGKKGVVREPEIHIEVINNVFEFTLAAGFEIVGLDFSPIKGPQGNIEYLMYIKLTDKPQICKEISIQNIVKTSHDTL